MSDCTPNGLDVTNELQIADHVGLTPTELLDLLADLVPDAVTGRTSIICLLRRSPIPLDTGKGSMMAGLPRTITLGHRPGGRPFQRCASGPCITMDALEWARTVSGREAGDGLLAHPVLV